MAFTLTSSLSFVSQKESAVRSSIQPANGRRHLQLCGLQAERKDRLAGHMSRRKEVPGDVIRLARRSGSPFQLVAYTSCLGMLLQPPALLEAFSASLGFKIMIVGLAFALWGVQSLGRANLPYSTLQPGVPPQLVRRGAYRIVRHPCYGGLMVAAFGLSVGRPSSLRPLLVAGLTLGLRQSANVEEMELATLHGEQWMDYSAEVTKRFLPFVV